MHKSPSDRIGSNYTPTSKHLRIKGIRELKRSMQIQRYVTLFLDLNNWRMFVTMSLSENTKFKTFHLILLTLGSNF